MEQALLVLGIIIIAGMLLRMRLRRDDPSGERARVRAYHESRQHEERHFKANLDQLLVELNETSRELTARLDTKLHLLNRLIEEADERIAALQRAGAAPAPHPQGTAAPSSGTAAPAAATPSAGPAAARPETQARVEAILTLAAQGLTAVEIAHRSGAPRGEVELVLSLHPRPAAPAGPAAGLGPSELEGLR